MSHAGTTRSAQRTTPTRGNRAAGGDPIFGGNVRLLLPVDEITHHNVEFAAEVRSRAFAAGVTQVLDLGCGRPAHVGSDHSRPDEIGIREVAVDKDTFVIRARQRQRQHQARKDKHGHGARDLPVPLRADLRATGSVLTSRPVQETLDLGKPVLLLATAVLHHIPNIQDPGAILARYLDALAPGSYVALSHLTIPDDQDGKRRLGAARGLYLDADRPVTARPRPVINGWLRGLNAVPVHQNGGHFLHVAAARKGTTPPAVAAGDPA